MNISFNGIMMDLLKGFLREGGLLITYEELIERVKMGEEFQFYLRNEGYWIS